MLDNEHSVGFYILEYYRLENDIMKLRAEKQKAQRLIDRFSISYQIATASLENQNIQEQISTSIDNKKIKSAEKIAFLIHNNSNKIKSILKRLSFQRSK